MTIATTTELICFLVLSAVVVIGALGVVPVSYTHLTLPTILLV